MTRSERIFFGIGLVWLAIWVLGGFLFFRAADAQRAEAEHLSRPLTPLDRGAEVRAEGIVEDGLVVAAPFTKTACVAAEARLYYVTSYEDSQDKTHYESRLVATRRTGPTTIGILVDGARLALPLDRWTPSRSGPHVHSESMDDVPDELAVTQAEIAGARAGARGRFEHFSVDETVLPGGTRVFVAGRLAAGEGPLVLEADPVIGRVELHAGTQAELVKDLRGSSSGLRIAGWIFGGVGLLPHVILAILVARRRKAARDAPAPLSGLPVDDRRE